VHPCIRFEVLAAGTIELVFWDEQYQQRKFFEHTCLGNVIPEGLINPLNAELNPICCLLALLGAHHFLHVSRIRVNLKNSTKA